MARLDNLPAEIDERVKHLLRSRLETTSFAGRRFMDIVEDIDRLLRSIRRRGRA
jgi:hypothetical protein